MNAIFAISGVVIKELYRRKDFYVLFVLTLLITLLVGAMRFFNDSSIVRILKETCLWLIWVSTIVIAVTTAARQIHAERENRTMFPLLAKPVSRLQVIVGKFFGCWFACGISLLFFYVAFGVVSGSREHTWPLGQYLQIFLLHWAMLAIITAFVLFGSLVFAAPSSNATISFVCIFGILLLGRYLNHIAASQPQPMGSILSAFYFIIPHLEWFDVRQLVVFDHPLIPWIYCGEATIYAALYSGLLLGFAWLIFRRKALNT
jgi:ABC-type transport system involved in multi-copper enzyme maturation permease subunit